jgi:hypothetical protein
MEVHGGVKHHIVVTKRGVRIALVKPVIDQQRSVVMVSHPSSNVHNGVFVDAQQGLEPDDDRAFTDRDSVFRQPATSLAEVFWQVHAQNMVLE